MVREKIGAEVPRREILLDPVSCGLFIQAASIGFDLRAAHEAGFIRLMRIPNLADIRHENDENVAQALTDLVDIIVRFQPTRVVINDFIPFIAFQSFRRFQSEFNREAVRPQRWHCTLSTLPPTPKPYVASIMVYW